MEPEAIVGDMDSLNEDLANRFADRIFRDESQDTNDLTKVVTWCRENNYKDIVIVGATGKREDHTLGNISLLTEYAKDMNVIMVTDTGILRPFLADAEICILPWAAGFNLFNRPGNRSDISRITISAHKYKNY